MDIEIQLTTKQADYHSRLFDTKGRIRTDTPEREFHYFGGFGSGKSRIVMTCVDQICRMYPNSHGAFIRDTYPELNDSVIPQYNSYFQQWKYSYNKAERTCNYANGTRLDFRAFDKDTKILSNEYDFIAFSQLEEIPEELFLQALGRNRRKIGRLPKNLILGEGNPAAGWVKARLKDRTLPKEICLIEARTRDNPFLPPDYEVNLRANYPDFWIARYLDGEWTNLDEAVFSEFREKTHVVNPEYIDNVKNYKIRCGLDYGWVNPTAIVWGYTDYDGILTIFDEWGGSQKTPQEIAREAFRHGKFTTVADYSIKKADRDGRSVWQDLQSEGMLLQESNKQEIENIVLANGLFKTGRLRITRNCINLLREIQNYKWKKVKLGSEQNRPETPVDKDNHWIDAMLYLIASLEELKTPDPQDIEFKKSLQYSVMHKNTKTAINRFS